MFQEVIWNIQYKRDYRLLFNIIEDDFLCQTSEYPTKGVFLINLAVGSDGKAPYSINEAYDSINFTFPISDDILQHFQTEHDIMEYIIGCIQMVEIHEMREFFLYKGKKIYDPHKKVGITEISEYSLQRDYDSFVDKFVNESLVRII